MMKIFIIKLLATWFKTGLIKYFPGTFGSIASLPFAALITFWGGQKLLLIFTIILFLIGIYIANYYSSLIGKKDPSEIVIDEVVGQWLVLVFVPLDLLMYIVALVLFRFFDILKPWPIKLVENKYDGGFGIMIDDILASIYSILIIMVLLRTAFL